MKPTFQLTPLTLFSGDSGSAMTPVTFTPTTMKSLSQLLGSGNNEDDVSIFQMDSVSSSGGSYFNLKRPLTAETDDPEIPDDVKMEELHEFPEIVVKKEVIVSEDSDEDYSPYPASRRASRRRPRVRPAESPIPTDLTVKPKRRGNLKNDYDGLPPSEREKLKQRRERNKEAAARCRKRREDLAKNLAAQVKVGDDKREALQIEIATLKKEKSRLEQLLREHEAVCGLNGSARKSAVVDDGAPVAKRSRPATLTLLRTADSPPADVKVETPSNGLDIFLSPISGLTPLFSPSDLLPFATGQRYPGSPCGLQQRTGRIDADLNAAILSL